MVGLFRGFADRRRPVHLPPLAPDPVPDNVRVGEIAPAAAVAPESEITGAVHRGAAGRTVSATQFSSRWPDAPEDLPGIARTLPRGLP
ncbi:MAG: hypothetical protein AB7H90_24000 [Alphaproteobacteria bacterium]